jgi:hypothetical protein
MKKTAPNTPADFMAKHHPMAQASAVRQVHSNPAPKGTVRYLFTAAQNATPVHPKVWAAILQAKKHFNAHLSVIQLRYKNPTSKWSRSQEDAEQWAPEVMPYALNQRMKVNRNLVCVGDVKIVPTATTPLSGFEGFTGAESAIIGHTRYQFKTVPVPGSQMAKLMTTTGACTLANYTNSRAGASGEFHHVFGAVLVEVDGGRFYLRHLNFTNDGVAMDVGQGGLMITPTGVTKAPRPEAIALGDTHVRFTDKSVDRATFGKHGLVTLLRPKRIYWHDVCDGYGANPHHDGNPFIDQAKALSGFDDVEGEVREAVNFVANRTPIDAISYIVPDNHGDFLRRWILKKDWKTEVPPIAREFYLKTALAMQQGTKMGKGGTETPSPWPYWVNKIMDEVWDRNRVKVVCLTGNGEEGSRVKDIQMDMHGHAGPNGSRGSIKNLRRIGVKSTIGHAHSPGVDEGCHQVGTSSLLKLEYNGAGPSGWLHAHDVTHANGKRQLVIIIDGEYELRAK